MGKLFDFSKLTPVRVLGWDYKFENVLYLEGFSDI